MVGLRQIACCCKERMGTCTITPKYAHRPCRPWTEDAYRRPRQEDRLKPPHPGLEGAGLGGSTLRPRSSAVPTLATSPSRPRCAHRRVASRTMMRRHEGFGMPGPGRIHRRPPVGLREASEARRRPGRNWSTMQLPPSMGIPAWRGRRSTHAMKNLPVLPFSRGGRRQAAGPLLPMPTGPAAATVPKDEARRCLGTFFQGPTNDQQTAPDKLDRVAGGRDRFDG